MDNHKLVSVSSGFDEYMSIVWRVWYKRAMKWINTVGILVNNALVPTSVVQESDLVDYLVGAFGDIFQ